MQSAQAKYGPAVTGTFTEANIYLVPLQFFEATVTVRTDGVDRVYKGESQRKDSTTIEVVFKVDSPTELESLSKAIDRGVVVSYRYAFTGQKVSMNKLTISAQEMQNLHLKESIEGPGGAGYVTRNQLSRVANSLFKTLDIYETYQIDGLTFEKEFIDEVVSQIFTREFEFVNIDSALASLSKAGMSPLIDDLKPDQIKSEMSKAFTLETTNGKTHVIVNRDIWDEGKKKLNTSGKLGTAASVMQYFSGSMDISFALSKEDEWKNGGKSVDDQLKELSKRSESNIEWAFEGNKIVPKSVNVVSVKNVDYKKALVVSRVRIKTAETSQLKSGQFHTVQHLGIGGSADVEDHVLTDIRHLQTQQPPIGSIIPFFGEPADVPSGWTLCDGKVLDEKSGFKASDVATRLWKKTVPNTNGRMLRGVSDGETVGTTGGTDIISGLETEKDGKHTHSFTDPTRGLTGFTGGIALSAAGWSNPGKFLLVDMFGAAHTDGKQFLQTDNDNNRNEQDRGKGQHRHTLDGNGKAQSAGQITTIDSEDVKHSHAIKAKGFVPSYTAVHYIMRIR